MARTITGKRASEIVLTICFFAGLLLYMVWPWLNARGSAEPPRRTLVVYGFSIVQEVMTKSIFPAFQKHWEEKAHEGVQILGSFSGSGTTANHILLGAPAQVALLATPGDAQRLVQADLVRAKDWSARPYGGVVMRTPIVIIVRRGNPKGIQDFSDLTREDVAIIHPDPLTSGGALWAILAEYGSALRLSEAQTGRRDRSEAYLQLEGIWRRITAQTSSARGARMQFESGFGDALITYEQEAVFDIVARRFHGEVIMPPATIYTEPVAVIVDRNVPEADRPLVAEFYEFLWSDAAQELFVGEGFRSVTRPDFNRSNPFFKSITYPFTVADMGGWDTAHRTIIQDIWQKKILQELKP